MQESMDERGIYRGAQTRKNCYLMLACEQNYEAARTLTRAHPGRHHRCTNLPLSKFHQPHRSNVHRMKCVFTIYYESTAVRCIYIRRKESENALDALDLSLKTEVKTLQR